MSCGDHHDVDCADILARMVFFVDHELENADLERIQQHLDECAPCLAEQQIEQTVKALVARSCCDQAPEHLRRRIAVSIREVHVQVTERRLDG
jgi:mycothiol system anti-sigma-R factor